MIPDECQTLTRVVPDGTNYEVLFSLTRDCDEAGGGTLLTTQYCGLIPRGGLHVEGVAIRNAA